MIADDASRAANECVKDDEYENTGNGRSTHTVMMSSVRGIPRKCVD